MKIDDKEIEKLLEDFDGENIKVPDELDEKLNMRLKELRPKKKHKKWAMAFASSILILMMSYIFVPSFKTFADTAFQYIFEDVGIENAVNFGYKGQPNKVVKIGGYDMRIENIYMDDLRISFDAIINDDIDGGENQYSLFVDGVNFEGIYMADGFFILEDNKLKANVQIVGDGVYNFIKGKDKLELDLKLVKHSAYYDENEIEDETLGETSLVLNVDKDIALTKEIKINKTIKDKGLNLNIEKLQVSPTMMYLDTSGEINGVGQLVGLYNFSITSERGDIYKEKMTLLGVAKEKGWRQTIVPSVYYDKSNILRLKAEGVLVEAQENIKIDLNDNYPKTVDYFDTTITINKVEYKDNKLIIEIKENDRISGIGSGYTLVDDVECSSAYYGGANSYRGFEFDIDKKDTYDFNLGLTLKYKYPIDVEIENTLSSNNNIETIEREESKK